MKSAVLGVKPDLASHKLVDVARRVVEPGGRLHLVAVLSISTEDEDYSETTSRARTAVEELSKSLVDSGFDVEISTPATTFSAGAELARIAKREKVDLLVIGLSKRSRVGKALLGSDAQTALLNAACPVLSVRFE